MTNLSFNQWVLIFVAYSFLGWVCETIWCSVGKRKFVNRGFLKGPWCPIYGFGGMIGIIATNPIKHNPVLVFLVVMVTCSVLEYFTGWLMETLFKATWWDYSKRKFQIKGRVCLGNAILFGLLGLATVYFIHPFTLSIINKLSLKVQWGLSALFLIIFFIDFIYSLSVVTNLTEKLENLRLAIEELERNQQQYNWYERKDLKGSFERLREVSKEEPDNQRLLGIIALIDQRTEGRASTKRLTKAYPNMKPKGFTVEVEAIEEKVEKDKLTTRIKDWYKRVKESLKKEWAQGKAAYKEITLTRMIWVFTIGSVIGYVVETLWGFFVTTGTWESRQGLVYGPFSQIYGIGAVLMVLVLTPFVKKGDGWLFAIGGIVGGVYEAIASLSQELVFGSVSWEYSEMPFSLLGGRTHLLYMGFWGILTIVYMKRIYPWMARLIDRVPVRPKRFFTWVISILLVMDMGISVIAVGRWSQRIAEVPPKNQVEVWVDEIYPDERMRKVYPHMDFRSIQN